MQNRSWRVLEVSWGILQAPEKIFVGSWSVLEASWEVLEASWGFLGRVLGCLRAVNEAAASIDARQRAEKISLGVPGPPSTSRKKLS